MLRLVIYHVDKGCRCGHDDENNTAVTSAGSINEPQLRISLNVLFTRVCLYVCVSDIEEELCDGNPVLINPRTGLEYNCNSGQDTCPAGSYCHKLVNVARCCQQGL